MKGIIRMQGPHTGLLKKPVGTGRDLGQAQGPVPTNRNPRLPKYARNSPQLPSFPKSRTAVLCAQSGEVVSRAPDGVDTKGGEVFHGTETRIESEGGGFFPALQDK